MGTMKRNFELRTVAGIMAMAQAGVVGVQTIGKLLRQRLAGRKYRGGGYPGPINTTQEQARRVRQMRVGMLKP